MYKTVTAGKMIIHVHFSTETHFKKKKWVGIAVSVVHLNICIWFMPSNVKFLMPNLLAVPG